MRIIKYKLISLIDEFGEGLTKYEYNHYVIKLRDYLVPYIEDKYSNSDIYILFTNEFTRSDIINSTLYYIEENKNVQRISAIDDFLISLNRFFVELVLDKYNNQNIRNLVPFTSLYKEVNETLISKGIKLLNKETYPPIDNEQYLAIIDYLRDYRRTRLQSYQVPIIIKLMLLYGFSFDRIAKLKIDCYDLNRNILQIIDPKDIRHVFNLELPYNLIKDFENMFQFRDKKLGLDSDYLFVTEENNRIQNSVVNKMLDKIRDKFQSDNEITFGDRNPFTTTGLQKYSIIRMILGGINQKIITEFTGQEEDILTDCQLEVNKDNAIERNRYVNHKIRGISTYDEL